MLTIRLTRKGKKKQPFFRVVLVDKRNSSKGGRSIEDLGYVNPLTKKRSINKERIQYWISKGAQPSDTIHNLLISEKVIEGKKIDLFKKSKNPEAAKPAEVAPAATPAPEAKAEQPAAEEPKPETPAA